MQGLFKVEIFCTLDGVAVMGDLNGYLSKRKFPTEMEELELIISYVANYT